MIAEFGMSEKLGSVRYAGRGMQYLGGSIQESEISPETREQIDKEVQRLMTEQYERAQTLLAQHRTALTTLAKGLLEHETVDGRAVKDALAEARTAAPA
jgi:cell division protease FtsH